MDRLTQFFRSFRKLAFVGALVAPMLWSSTSFAYFPAPLSPLFWGVDPNSPDGCFGGGGLTTDSQFVPCGNPAIGYAFKTQVSGTLLLFNGADPNSPDGCFGGTVYTTDSQRYVPCNNTIPTNAYVYATQAPGTVPLFWGVDPNSPDGCFGGGVVTIDSQRYVQCGNTIAYVYPSLPASTPFTLSPTYFIGSVTYVPPGSASSMSYSSGTVVGSTVSTTDSWSVESTAGVQIGMGDTNINVTFGNVYGGETTHSVDMQQTVTQTTNFRAPPSDFINHDYDQIRIFAGVKVNGAIDYLGAVTWGMDFSQIANQNFAEEGYLIAVGCLRLNSTIPASDCASTVNLLTSLGVTSADYSAILGADPFADPTAPQVPDPSRYVLIDTEAYFFDPVTSTFTYAENNNTTITNSVKTSYSYSVSVSASDGFDFGALKGSQKFTWTHSSTDTNKTGTTNSNTFTLSMPSSVYNGPTTLRVYMDTIFKTFMFSFQ